jgi:hypothetical protein
MNINNNDKIVAKNLHRNMDRNADKHADKHATSKHHLLVSSMDGKVGILEYWCVGHRQGTLLIMCCLAAVFSNV